HGLRARVVGVIGSALSLSILVVRGSGENHHGPVECALAGEQRSGLDRIALSFKAGQPRCLHYDLGVGLDAPSLAEFRYRSRRYRDRIEHRAFNATKNGADPVRRNAAS